jgi:hypothetical protein
MEWSPVYHVKGWGKFNRHYGDFCTGADMSAFSPPLIPVLRPVAPNIAHGVFETTNKWRSRSRHNDCSRIAAQFCEYTSRIRSPSFFSSIEPRLKVSSKFAVQLSDPHLGVLAFTSHGYETVVQEILSVIKHSDY